MSKISLNPIKATWNINEKIEFEVIYENPRKCNFLEFNVKRIFEKNDVTANGFMLPLIEVGNNKYKVNISLKEVGVYYISSVNAQKFALQKGSHNKYDMSHPTLFDSFEKEDFFSPYFLISNKENEKYTSAAINKYVSEIFQKRESDLKISISKNSENKEFQAIVVCKDIYITSSYYFEYSKIKPFKPTNNNHIISEINDYLNKDWKKFEYGNDRKDILYSPNPQAIIEFPKIYALNHEEVTNIVENETEFILGAYALSRSSYGEIIGIAIKNTETQEQYLTISQLDYIGNIATGDHFGENPFLNNNIISSMKSNGLLQLCISLYNEALKENNIEFAFAKYWFVLEVLAESKQYKLNRVRKQDLDGKNIIEKNKNFAGKKDYVRELIRDKVDDEFLVKILKTIPEIKNKEDILTMWYMHRNCAVHNGGCICGVLPKCKKVCELITREHIKVQKGIETQQNVLLTTIRETISIILLSETNIKKIIPGVHKVRKREFLGIDNK